MQCYFHSKDGMLSNQVLARVVGRYIVLYANLNARPKRVDQATPMLESRSLRCGKANPLEIRETPL